MEKRHTSGAQTLMQTNTHTHNNEIQYKIRKKEEQNSGRGLTHICKTHNLSLVLWGEYSLIYVDVLGHVSMCGLQKTVLGVITPQV